MSVREERFRAACRAVAELIKRGTKAISPIVHCHPLVQHGLMGHWSAWADYNRQLLSRCSALWVLTIPGWQSSTGIDFEIEIATELSMSVMLWDGHGEVAIVTGRSKEHRTRRKETERNEG